MKRVALGLILGVMVASAATAGAAWITTQVDGEASGTLGRLSPVEVEIRAFTDVLPGEKAALVGTVTNGNRVALRVTDVRLTDLTSSEGEECARGNFLPQIEGVVFDPGKTPDVLVAKLDVPDSLASKCQGAELKLRLSITTSFGS